MYLYIDICIYLYTHRLGTINSLIPSTDGNAKLRKINFYSNSIHHLIFLSTCRSGNFTCKLPSRSIIFTRGCSILLTQTSLHF